MDHFNYKDHTLHAEGVDIAQLAQQVGTPFYCYSTATLIRHFRVFSESFSAFKPRICYAVKANPNLALLKTLAREGAGADVVSEGEIRLALAAGIPSDKIVFSGVGKTREEMAFALAKKIFQFNVESVPELELLNEVALAAGTRAAIAIRVNPDVIPHTHAKISTGQKESKFGIPMREAFALYSSAMEMKGIAVQGVSVHIGSQLTKLAPFGEAFARVREFVSELRAKGVPIRTVDLGGGLGIPYGKEEPPLPAAYADIVAQNIQGMDCELMFEPGRVLVGNAGILVSRVIYVKRSRDKLFVIVDAGMNDLIRPTLYSAHHEIVPVRADTQDAPTELVDVVGPVCETGDYFALDRLMKVPAAGDLLAFRSAGAYGAAMSGTYNARPLIAEVLVKDSAFALTRPRQTYEELLGQYAMPQWL